MCAIDLCLPPTNLTAGSVDVSILLVAGSHARLENISEDGRWVQPETFSLAGKVVHRRAGESVGNIMKSWRAVRLEDPSHFSGLRLWASPTAMVDSIVWAWMQEEEASRFEAEVRVVDALATCWTPASQERNYLQQTVQGAVAAGGAPLLQVTDTSLASA